MSTIKVGTLLAADGSTTTQPSIPALDKRMAQAWVNFNGTGNVAIRAAYNVSSITDSATGIYLINFATTLANANYAVTATSHRTVTWANGGIDANNYTTTNFRLENVENSTGADTPTFGVQVMGGQA